LERQPLLLLLLLSLTGSMMSLAEASVCKI
jgi:hypothetical protein